MDVAERDVQREIQPGEKRRKEDSILKKIPRNNSIQSFDNYILFRL